MYTRIEPEVAGGLGPGVDYDHMRQPTLIGPLHYEFQGWLGDDIVTTAGFWLVADRLAVALRASHLTGYELAEVVVTKDPQFEMFYPDLELPEWQRLVPTGTAEGGDDFALEGWSDMLISERALELLRHFQIDAAELSDGEQPAAVSEIMERFLQVRANREHE